MGDVIAYRAHCVVVILAAPCGFTPMLTKVSCPVCDILDMRFQPLLVPLPLVLLRYGILRTAVTKRNQMRASIIGQRQYCQRQSLAVYKEVCW